MWAMLQPAKLVFFPTRMMRVFHMPWGSLDSVRRLAWVEERELFCCFPVKIPSFFLHLQRKGCTGSEGSAAEKVPSVQSFCQNTRENREAVWMPGTPIKSNSIMKENPSELWTALRSSGLVQSERVYQGSAATCLPWSYILPRGFFKF